MNFYKTLNPQQPQLLYNVKSNSSASSISSRSSSNSVVSDLTDPAVDPDSFNSLDDTVYVAMGKEAKDWKANFVWLMQNIPRNKKITILHIHQPSKTIPMAVYGVIGWLTADQVPAKEMTVYRKIETEKMNKTMSTYMSMFARLKMKPEKLIIESDDIAEGLLSVITKHSITELVMGAGADNTYSKTTKAPVSPTALTVKVRADPACKIWFICNGKLICTREPAPSGPTATGSQKSAGQTPNRSQSDRMPLHGSVQSASPLSSPLHDQYQGSRSDHLDATVMSGSTSPYNEVSRVSSTGSVVVDLWNEKPNNRNFSGEEPYQESSRKSRSNTDDQGRNYYREGHKTHQIQDFHRRVKKFSGEAKPVGTDKSPLKLKIQEESGCPPSPLDYTGSTPGKDDGMPYPKGRWPQDATNFDDMKRQRDDILEELHRVEAHRDALEDALANSKHMVKDLQTKLSEAHCLVFSLEREVEELQQERGSAVKEVNMMRERVWELERAALSRAKFCEFSYEELQDATDGFDYSFKIGEGGYGSVFKGSLRGTTVAIKLLNPQGMSGKDEFYQEIPPLTWRARVRIAAEICSALIFLHSTDNKQNPVIHGDLKPSNILLDSNFVCRLGDYGIWHVLEANPTNILSRCSGHMGSFVYMDPEFFSSGELQPCSDVYSFGIVLLRLLTGQPAMGIINEVQKAVVKGSLEEILDKSAGEWPDEVANQIAALGIECCEVKRELRPDLVTDVWQVLEPMLNLPKLDESSLQGYRMLDVRS